MPTVLARDEPCPLKAFQISTDSRFGHFEKLLELQNPTTTILLQQLQDFFSSLVLKHVLSSIERTSHGNDTRNQMK